MKKIFKIILRTFLFIIACVAVYFLSALVLSKLSIDKEDADNPEITAYILSNGVHTDIVVPVNNEIFNWQEFVQRNDILSKDTTFNFIGFGWGDKGFYLETPTWADLKFKTAFKAAFGLGASAMHVTYHKPLKEGERCKKLTLTNRQYLSLVEYIKQTFLLDENNETMNISTKAVYGITDAFYEAKGNYNLFETCNTWTNTSLKKSGQKACVWTPFEAGIFYHYKN
jgi:uncharacterized protein (TIGR02117 family)